MVSLYYQSPSGSVTSSVYVVDNNSISITYSDIILETSSSKYLISGSSNYLDYTRVYIKSGSIIYASFPLEKTSIYYQDYKELSPNPANDISIDTPLSASFLTNYYFYPTPVESSINEKFQLTGSSLFYNTSTNINISQSQNYGSLPLIQGDIYTIILSGSGQFYNSSLTIINTFTLTTSSYITASNSYISTNFSSSTSDNYNIIAQTQTLPYLRTTFSSSASIPVTPTSSLSAWNTYLNVSASQLSSSGNTFWVVGDTLYNNTSAIIITGSGLNDYYGFGMNNIVSYSLYNNKLSSFPNTVTSSGTIYFNVDTNLISGTLPNLATTNSIYLQTFIASNNKLSGSIPALSSSFNLKYFNVSNNYLTGNIDLSRCYNMQYFNASNNQLSGSILDITSSCGNLQYFNFSNNYINGNIPSLSSSFFPNLTDFICTNNGGLLEYHYTSDVFSPTLLNFQAYNANLFKADTIENILYALDAGGGISGSVNMSGSTNATIGGGGYALTASLKSKGWTVYVN